jgi:hypothetical protein
MKQIPAVFALFFMTALCACTAPVRQTLTIVNASRRPLEVSVLPESISHQTRAPEKQRTAEWPHETIPAGGTGAYPLATMQGNGVPSLYWWNSVSRLTGPLCLYHDSWLLPPAFGDQAVKWNALPLSEARRRSNAGQLIYRSRDTVFLSSTAGRWKLMRQQ